MSQKWPVFVNQLVRMTRDRKIVWKETSDETTFIAPLDAAIVELELKEDDSEFVIRIINKQGRILDSFNDEDMMSVTGEYWFREVKSLASDIRRSISGADEVLDRLLAELDRKEDEIPF